MYFLSPLFDIVLLPISYPQIPSELGWITYLESFSVGRNALKGTLPTELGLLDGLFELGLSNNELSGVVSDLRAVVYFGCVVPFLTLVTAFC